MAESRPENLFFVWEKIRSDFSREISSFPLAEDNAALRNILSLKLLLKEAKKLGKTLDFAAEGGRGQALLASLQNGVKVDPKVADLPPLSRFGGHKPRRVLAALIVLAVLGLVSFFALSTVPSATITLTFDSETLAQSFEVTATPSAMAVSRERRVIPAVLLTAQESGEEVTPSSGKKEKGEKAKGEVLIYNWTDEEKDFEAGTAITLIRVEGEKLRFLLSEAALVPPQTASVSATPSERVETTLPGKKVVSVAAEKVGEEYNLAKDLQFSLMGLSTDDFMAQNMDKFAGGKKEEVKVVAAEDQKRTSARLFDDLSRKAKSDILSRTVGDQELLEGAVVYKIEEEFFDKKEGEEAPEFKTRLTIKASALVFSRDNLKELLSQLLENNLPPGFVLMNREVVNEESAAKIEEVDDGDYALDVIAKVRASVVPALNQEDVKRNVSGRTLETAQRYLRSLPNVSSVNISLFPALPGPFERLPRFPNRIELRMKNQ